MAAAGTSSSPGSPWHVLPSQGPGSWQSFSFLLQLIQEGRWKSPRVSCSPGSILSGESYGPRQGADPDVSPLPCMDVETITGVS